MEAIMTTPSTQPIVGTQSIQSPEPVKVEMKTAKPTLETKVENYEDAKPAEVTKEFNQVSNSLDLGVQFGYNAEIDTVFISVTDKATGKVIRQLPTEEAMKIKESMKELVGVLFDKKG